MEKSLTKIINKLKDYKKNPETRKRHNSLITRLNIGLERLENDTSNMYENDVNNQKLDYRKDIVKTIVDVNQKLDDMPDLESKESASQKQKGQGLKILTPKQITTRLPIFIAQLKA